MSHVTDIIILCNVSDDEVLEKALTRVWKHMRRSDSIPLRLATEVGGTKALQAEVFIGAYNYLNLPDFFSYLRKELQLSKDLAFKENVQVLFKDEHDEKFTFVGSSPLGILDSSTA